MSAIRVVLVDDQQLFRKGVRALLEEEGGFEIVGEAGDGALGLEIVLATHPDVVLMDVQMPVCTGVVATRNIKAQRPDTRVIMLTVSDVDEDLSDALKA